MINPIASFFLGLFCTVALFAICLLSVCCAKILFIWARENLFYKRQQPPPKPHKTPVVKRAPKKATTIPKPVRSIEIDPDQIDKIYVKKIS